MGPQLRAPCGVMAVPRVGYPSRMMRPRFVLPWLLVACSRPETPPAHVTRGPNVVVGSRTAEPATVPMRTGSSAAADVGPASSAERPAPTTPPREKAAQHANRFALDLFRSVAKADQNTLVSGASARQSLGVVYLGARGATAVEMERALSLSPSLDEAAAEGFHEARAYETARGEARLRFANRLWAERRYRFRGDFRLRAEGAFGGGFASADFFHEPELERAAANAWVAEQTDGRIKDLLPPGSVTVDTRLVVANAVWLKAAFRTAFQESATTPAPFATPRGKKDVPTMHQTASFPYYDGKLAQLVELPYDQSKLALLIVLPKAENGLAEMVKKLDEPALAEMTRFLIRTRVELSLPKFTFGWGAPLDGPLKAMGLRLAFTDKADLSGLAELSEGKPLGLTGVFHKTFIAVDEKGTEAAAATGVVVGVKSGVVTGQPVAFHADHPFFFVIRDTETGRLLFTGQLHDPG